MHRSTCGFPSLGQIPTRFQDFTNYKLTGRGNIRRIRSRAANGGQAECVDHVVRTERPDRRDLKLAVSSTLSALYNLKVGDDGTVQGSITNCPINWMIFSDSAAIRGSGIEELFNRESYSSLGQLKEDFIARVISNVGH